MRIAKWGNSLAVRLPAKLIDEMGLKEGDEIDVFFNSNSEIEVARSRRREEAMEAIRKLARPFPPDYKFDREEANAR